MADGFTPISVPVHSISAQVFAAGIREALEAGDNAKAARMERLWRGFVDDDNAF